MKVPALVELLLDDIGKVLLGKREQVKLSLTCLFAGGHLLLEDLPGLGKTTLSHALANALGLDYKRVQFTNDLLPADILGISLFNRRTNEFEFKPGPVFSQVLLADEINRSSPKTQSALLEAMAEGQVTIDGISHPLPHPFFVIATQNPVAQSGTHPLPESQLDRFLMRMSLGYPDRDAELAMYRGQDPSRRLNSLAPRLDSQQLLRLQAEVAAIKTSEGLLDYVQRLIHLSRHHPDFAWGISPRGGLSLLHCAKAWAMVNGRRYVTPEDIQQLLIPVLAHRVRHTTDTSVFASERLIMLLRDQVEVVG